MVEKVTVLLTPDGLLEGVYKDYEDAKEKAKESNHFWRDFYFYTDEKIKWEL